MNEINLPPKTVWSPVDEWVLETGDPAAVLDFDEPLDDKSGVARAAAWFALTAEKTAYNKTAVELLFTAGLATAAEVASAPALARACERSGDAFARDPSRWNAGSADSAMEDPEN